MDELLTVEAVAQHFGITSAQVIARCKERRWPHLRPARAAATWRFSREQLVEIERILTAGPAVDTWGRAQRR